MFTIDGSSPVPLYGQVADAIRAAVNAGTMPEGTQIGPEHRLAKDFHVSVPTIRKALDLLEAEGIVVRKRGLGTYVSAKVRKASLTTNFLGDAGLLSFGEQTLESIVADAEVRREFGLPDGARTWRLRRIPHLLETPVAVLDDYFSSKRPLQETGALSEVGAVAIAAEQEAKTHLSRNRISAESAGLELSALLGVPRGHALISLERTAFGWNDQPFTYSRHIFQPKYYRMETTF